MNPGDILLFKAERDFTYMIGVRLQSKQELYAKQSPQVLKTLLDSLSQAKYPELYAVACLVLDFLSIHPFRDGNGRVGRLLTLLALYQHGFTVGKYISLERVIEQSKETYYETLNKSSQRWHEAKHDLMPWFNYFLGTIVAAYKEFEERASHIKPGRGAKTQLVTQAIERQSAISEIERECSGVSRPMIRVILEKLRAKGKVKVLGTGRSAHWRKSR
jgi:Fic family protein